MDEEQFIRENRDSLSNQEIADKLGITVRRVHQLIYGVYKIKKVTNVKRAEDNISEFLKDYYEDRLTIKDVMAKYNIGRSSVKKLLKQYGRMGRKHIEYENYAYECDLSFFEKIDTPEKAYWFGFLMADGCIHKSRLILNLSYADTNHLKLFAKRIGYTGPIVKISNGWGYSICRSKLTNDLKKLGMVERKTSKIDHTAFDSIPEKFLPAALHGYIDGDGSFYFKGKWTITFSLVGNEKFLNWVNKFLLKFDIDMTPPRWCKNSKHTFMIAKGFGFIKSRYPDKFKKLLYENEFASKDFLERKRKKLYGIREDDID